MYITPFLGSFKLGALLSNRPTAAWWARPPGPSSGFEIGRSIQDFKSIGLLEFHYLTRNRKRLEEVKSAYLGPHE